MTEVNCPFCGCVHDTEVMDLTAHYAPYLQGLEILPAQIPNLNPTMVFRGMKALRETTGDPRFAVRTSDLNDGWTGD